MVLTAPILAFAAGATSHVLYFSCGEHHMHGIFYLRSFLVVVLVQSVLLMMLYSYSTSQALSHTLYIAGLWFAGMYTSLIIYRLFLNPLNNFPGPFMPRMTGFWQAFRYAKLDSYYKLDDLHRKYGDFVRVGPSDLSITDPAAVEIAFAKDHAITKSSWYDGDAPLRSLVTCQDKHEHDRRRRVWSPAFSAKALRNYEPRIDELSAKLFKRFSDLEGTPINVTKWFILYSFDVMGRLAFGKDYGMLDSGEKHHALEMLSDGMAPVGFRLPIWFFRVFVRIPGLGPARTSHRHCQAGHEI